ncbi:MAG: hypothetical protein ACRDRW_16845 [Pseudonocardiaceae bacterium]
MPDTPERHTHPTACPRKEVNQADGATPDAPRANRITISVTRAVHRGPRGFANLVVEKQGEEIVLDPHVTGECVIILDEDGATELFEVLRR